MKALCNPYLLKLKMVFMIDEDKLIHELSTMNQ